MSLRANLPGYRWLDVLHSAAIRTGVYAGVCLSGVFVVWIYIANRVPSLDLFASERNMTGASLIALFGAVPLLRFFRLPGNLLGSGLVAWSIFCATYRGLCFTYPGLEERHTTFQMFILGALVYLIAATMSWIATCIWRVRSAHISHTTHVR
jgi:hypothetical protein